MSGWPRPRPRDGAWTARAQVLGGCGDGQSPASAGLAHLCHRGLDQCDAAAHLRLEGASGRKVLDDKVHEVQRERRVAVRCAYPIAPLVGVA